MAVEERVYLIKKDLILIFDLTVILLVMNAVTTVITFVLYVLARMREQTRKEQLYRSIHFVTLALFVLMGVLLLIQISHRIEV